MKVLGPKGGNNSLKPALIRRGGLFDKYQVLDSTGNPVRSNKSLVLHDNRVHGGAGASTLGAPGVSESLG